MAAQFAFRNSRVEPDPLEAGNVIGASDCAVAAADALGFVPTNGPGLRILVQRLKGTASSTGRLEAVHALALNKRSGTAIRRLVELDYVAGEIVEIVGRLVQAVAAG